MLHNNEGHTDLTGINALHSNAMSFYDSQKKEHILQKQKLNINLCHPNKDHTHIYHIVHSWCSEQNWLQRRGRNNNDHPNAVQKPHQNNRYTMYVNLVNKQLPL